MVRGKSIMFYIHYDEQGNIESVANHNNATLSIPTTKEIYDDFSFGKKHFHEYKIIEDIRAKGKMHLVPTEFDESVNNAHETGIITLADYCSNGIQIVQTNESWIVNNFIDDVTTTSLSISEEYIKEYYIVDKDNRFLLLDMFSLNLKDIAMKEQTVINNNIENKAVSIITRNSHIPHVHTIGLNYENN
jgi:hypothetical protein